MYTCDLKSAVSERAKDAGHSTDWASVKIIGQENYLLSRKICESINIHTRRPEWTVIHLRDSPKRAEKKGRDELWVSNFTGVHLIVVSVQRELIVYQLQVEIRIYSRILFLKDKSYQP